MSPYPLLIERSELDALREAQAKNHREWPAAFSTNEFGEIWCFTHFGRTPVEERIFVHGQLTILDRIAEIYRYERPGGGRFFVSDIGVFYSEEQSEPLQIIEFSFMD